MNKQNDQNKLKEILAEIVVSIFPMCIGDEAAKKIMDKIANL